MEGLKMASKAIQLQYKTEIMDVLLTPIQFRIIKTLEKHPKGLFRGLNNESGSLMKLLGNSRTTIYDNLVKLEKKNLVEKYSKNEGNRGRPKEYWRLKSPDHFARYRNSLKKKQERAKKIKNGGNSR